MGWLNKIHTVSSNGPDAAFRVSLIAQNLTFAVFLIALNASQTLLIAAFALCILLPLPSSASRKSLKQSLAIIAAKLLIAVIIYISLA
jgi:hypothetical protein